MIKLYFFIFFTLFLSYGKSIENFHPINRCIEHNNTKSIAIREFESSNKNYYLIVLPNLLKTAIIYKKSTKITNCNFFTQTKYYKLLKSSISNSKHPLQNDGITKGDRGLYLTIDLCPSSKRGFEERLYKSVIKSFENPVPVTVFITKRWIDSHKKELEELKYWQDSNKLDITWGNHTAKHIYHPKVPLNKNFVLSKEENLKRDILDLEIELIKNSITPSIFFRFPGLVSNKNSLHQVYNLGLITIGSNAWLAKGELPKIGSIILVHGNKNEPKGVDIFLNLIKNSKIKTLKSLTQIVY